jgi:hypothetical protein
VVWGRLLELQSYKTDIFKYVSVGNTQEEVGKNNAQIAVYNDIIAKNTGLIDNSGKASTTHVGNLNKELDAYKTVTKTRRRPYRKSIM